MNPLVVSAHEGTCQKMNEIVRATLGTMNVIKRGQDNGPSEYSGHSAGHQVYISKEKYKCKDEYKHKHKRNGGLFEYSGHSARIIIHKSQLSLKSSFIAQALQCY